MVKAIESKEEWDTLVASGEPFVADFWATWCGPCKLISPHFEKLEGEVSGVKFVKVDVDEQGEIAQELSIRSMPTFLGFKDGKRVKELIGASPAKLVTLVKEVAAL